jgi:voltage-gated potassium channel
VNVKRLVECSDTRIGRTFDFLIQFLVLLSLVSFSVETLPDLSADSRRVLRAIEVLTVSLFSVEYILRLLVADRKLSFVFSFFGIVDLLAIAPFYLALGVDLRSIRVVRFLRIFRMLKLARYSAAIQRFHRAIVTIREELVLFGAAALVVLYVSAVGIYYFERNAQPESFGSVFHCLWWALVSLTTVGYGDVYPITVGGRWFTSVVVVLGLGVIAVPTGLLASALSQARAVKENHRKDRQTHGS